MDEVPEIPKELMDHAVDEAIMIYESILATKDKRTAIALACTLINYWAIGVDGDCDTRGPKRMEMVNKIQVRMLDYLEEKGFVKKRGGEDELSGDPVVDRMKVVRLLRKLRDLRG